MCHSQIILIIMMIDIGVCDWGLRLGDWNIGLRYRIQTDDWDWGLDLMHRRFSLRVRGGRPPPP